MYTCLKCNKLVDKIYENSKQRHELRLCSPCWRNTKNRWNLGKTRGINVPIELYIKNDRVQLKDRKRNAMGNYYYEKQRCQRSLAMPKWVNIEAIADFYDKCPQDYHVDHIVPIKGKNVSGLHVIWNLQYLPASINLSKRNKF